MSPAATNNNNHLGFRAFDWSAVRPHATWIIIGKRGSGKTTAAKEIIYHTRGSYDCAVVFSPTEPANRLWQDILPRAAIHYEYDPKRLKAIMADQTVKRLEQEAGMRRKVPEILVVFDDCAYDASAFCNDKVLRQCVMNGRHFFITPIIISQYPRSIPPPIRSQMDYAVFLRDNPGNQRCLYEDWFGMLPDFGAFQTLLRRCTVGHGAVIVSNVATSLHPRDCVFWHQVREHKSFEVGGPAFRKWFSQRTKDARTILEEQRRARLDIRDAAIAPTPAVAQPQPPRVRKPHRPKL